MANFIPVRGSRSTRFTSTLAPTFPIWSATTEYQVNNVIMHNTNTSANPEFRVFAALEDITRVAGGAFNVHSYDITFSGTATTGSTTLTIDGTTATFLEGVGLESIIKEWVEQFNRDIEFAGLSSTRAKYIGDNIVNIAENTTGTLTEITTGLDNGITTLITRASTQSNIPPHQNALWNNIDEDPEFSGIGVTGPAPSTDNQLKGYFAISSENSAINDCFLEVFEPTPPTPVNPNGLVSISWALGSTSLNDRQVATIIETDGVIITPAAGVTLNTSSTFATANNSFSTVANITYTDPNFGVQTSNVTLSVSKFTTYFVNGIDQDRVFQRGVTDIVITVNGTITFELASSIADITTAFVNGFPLTIAAPVNGTTRNSIDHDLYTVTGTIAGTTLTDLQ